jgi:hypothetical protein
MTMKRCRRGLLLTILAAVGACAADDEAPAAGPNEEEIELVQRSFCELETFCCRCTSASDSPYVERLVEECVAGLESVYAFSEECLEAHFAWESCALQLEEDNKADDPEGNACEAFREEGRHGPCSEEWLAKEIVDCSV